jgi:hypothetical protein
VKCICNKKKKTAVRNLQSKLDPLPPQPGEQRGQKKNIKDNEECSQQMKENNKQLLKSVISYEINIVN